VYKLIVVIEINSQICRSFNNNLQELKIELKSLYLIKFINDSFKLDYNLGCMENLIIGFVLKWEIARCFFPF